MDPVGESLRHLVKAWELQVGRLPEGRIEALDGAHAVFGHVTFPFYNMVFVDRPTDGAALRASLATARAYGDPRQRPWMTTLCDAWLPSGWERIVDEVGMRMEVQLIGMVADELSPPRRPAPELTFRETTDPAQRDHLTEINRQAYDLPHETVECLREPALWDGMHGSVGWANGEAVTSSVAFGVEDVLYVAMVATRPGFGRRGYAEAAMRDSLARAGRALGLTRTALHASEAGFPLYRSMGYREVARFTLVTPKTDASPQA